MSLFSCDFVSYSIDERPSEGRLYKTVYHEWKGTCDPLGYRFFAEACLTVIYGPLPRDFEADDSEFGEITWVDGNDADDFLEAYDDFDESLGMAARFEGITFDEFSLLKGTIPHHIVLTDFKKDWL